MPMRALPVRLIRSQVGSVFDCARAGAALTAASVAAGTPATAMSRRRIVTCAPLLNLLVLLAAGHPFPARPKGKVPRSRDAGGEPRAPCHPERSEGPLGPQQRSLASLER